MTLLMFQVPISAFKVFFVAEGSSGPHEDRAKNDPHKRRIATAKYEYFFMVVGITFS
jgi:hypothetical protein